MSRSIAILGCGSSVGKTTIVTALCRYYSSASCVPFKAFNLSSESFIYKDSLIGYAQYIQALAAKVDYSVYMNPILKCHDGNSFDLYINGKRKEVFTLEEGKSVADVAYNKLREEHNMIIVEGSGSVAELNIEHLDIANTAFALKHNIPIILVADISRGGVFGTVYGNLALLSSEVRQLVKGVIINKFNGDPSYFDDGVRIIEKMCDTKVIGVVPTINFDLPHEDTNDNIKNFTDMEIEENIEVLTKNVIENLDIDYINSVIE